MRITKLAVISLWLCAALASASPTSPVDGVDYKTLTPPQPVQTAGKKIEVIEFFMYHCPACNLLEPYLLDWAKRQGDNIVLRRIHVPHNGAKDVEAHLFLTLEALNLEQSMRARVLNAWHVEHQRLLTDQDNIEWAQKNGLDSTRFIDAYYSFSVTGRLAGLMRVAQSYGITSTPSLVIDGRYVTGLQMMQDASPATAGTGLETALMQAADALVAKARAEK